MLAPFLALAMMQPSAPNGAKLYYACRASIRMAEAVKPDPRDVELAQYCIGYFAGALESFDITSTKVYCIPASASPETLIRLYIQFVAKYPKNMDEPQIIGFYKALSDSYPCHAK